MLVLAVVVAGSAAAGAQPWWNHDGDSDNSHEIKKLTLARYYGEGADGTLSMETLPFTGELTTCNLTPGPGPDYAPNYVPDSAPTATAWSTGKKTIDARLSQGPSAAETIPGSNAGFRTTFEIAAKRGMRVGNVSTAEQQVDHLLDVNLGGGRGRFLQTLDGSTDTVLDYAKDEGYQYVEAANELGSVKSLAKGPVLGLFTSGNMTTEFNR